MRYRVTFMTGFAAGYVLGTRAGRARYEALARTARGLKENPSVQEAAGVLQAQAAGTLGAIKNTVASRVGGRDVTDTVTPPMSTPFPPTVVLGTNGGGPHH